MEIVSYNIQFGRGLDRNIDLERICRSIKDLHANTAPGAAIRISTTMTGATGKNLRQCPILQLPVAIMQIAAPRFRFLNFESSKVM